MSVEFLTANQVTRLCDLCSVLPNEVGMIFESNRHGKVENLYFMQGTKTNVYVPDDIRGISGHIHPTAIYGNLTRYHPPTGQDYVSSLYQIRNHDFAAAQLVFERKGVWVVQPTGGLIRECIEVEDDDFDYLLEIASDNTDRLSSCLSLGGQACDSFSPEDIVTEPLLYAERMRTAVDDQPGNPFGFVVLFVPVGQPLYLPPVLVDWIRPNEIASSADNWGLKSIRVDAPVDDFVEAILRSPKLDTSSREDRFVDIDS